MSQSSKSVRPQVLRRSKVLAEGSSFCCYPNRVCMQMRIEGYDYCARHILQDKNCPFKQCQYVSDKTSKRCTNAVLRTDKRDGYCTEHTRQAALMKYQSNRKRKPKESPELLLEGLEHYNPKSSGSNVVEQKRNKPFESSASKLIEYLSSSDSEAEPLTIEQTWYGDGDSDAESIDSEQEDPLKHAGVYTAEEVALITRDKLIRLQSLYIDQFKWLQHEMKEKRRRYLHTVCREREALGGIHYAKNDPEQRTKYEELVAMKRYHRRYGQEALLHRQSKERRIAVSEGIKYRPPSYPKCIHSRSGIKCGARTVPLSKYCLEHILSDPHQVLFKPCNYASQCRRPVIAVANNTTCLYHAQPATIEYRLPNRDEKDDSKMEIDVVGDTKQEEPQQSLQLQLQLQQLTMNTAALNTKPQSCDSLSRIVQTQIKVVPPKISTTLKVSHQKGRNSTTPIDIQNSTHVSSDLSSKIINICQMDKSKNMLQVDDKVLQTSVLVRSGMARAGTGEVAITSPLSLQTQPAVTSGGLQVAVKGLSTPPVTNVPQVVSDLVELEKNHQQCGTAKQLLLKVKEEACVKNVCNTSRPTDSNSDKGENLKPAASVVEKSSLEDDGKNFTKEGKIDKKQSDKSVDNT